MPDAPRGLYRATARAGRLVQLAQYYLGLALAAACAALGAVLALRGNTAFGVPLIVVGAAIAAVRLLAERVNRATGRPGQVLAAAGALAR